MLMKINRFSRSTRFANAKNGEMNVVPYIDVMLVLLVIFMVAAPMLTTGVDVNPPQQDTKPIAISDAPPVIVAITADGKLFVSHQDAIDEAIDADALGVLLQAMFAKNANTQVMIQADEQVAYKSVMQVMAIAQNAGIEQISLLSEPDKWRCIMQTNAQRPSLLLPILLSVLLHAGLFALLFAPFSLDKPETTKASLISQNTLEQAKSSLKKTTSDTPKPPKAPSQTAVGSHSSKSSWQTAKPIQNEISQPAISTNTNTDTFNANWQTNHSQPNDDFASTSSADAIAHNDLSEPIISEPTPEPPAPKVDLAQAKNAINNRIQSIWQSYPNEPNQAISATVRLDDGGYVIGIDFRAGHKELQATAETAIRAAAPFSELAGVQNSFNIRLVTTQEITQ